MILREGAILETTENKPPPQTPSRKDAIRTFLLGGLLPIIAFTVIEEMYGPLWGLIAGMAFGIGEIAYEYFKKGKVEMITLGATGLLLVLGGISLVAQDGVWFKLQPAMMEGAMALVLWGTSIAGRPLLVEMTLKQQPNIPPQLIPVLKAMNWRFGIFMAFNAALATWAALHWSTSAWALLKGVGFTVGVVLYFVAEAVWLRLTVRRRRR